MAPSKPNFLHVDLVVPLIVGLFGLQFARMVMMTPTMIMRVPMIRSRHLSDLGTLLILQMMPMAGLEFCPVFIESDGMTEVAHGSIGGRKG